MPNASAIRNLFLQPKPTLHHPRSGDRPRDGLARGARVGGVGELEGVDTDVGLRVPWSELVSFGMDFWSQEVVEEALGADVAEAIPELLRLTDLEVRIPRMEVVALERVAARDGKSVSRVLARELLDFVSANSPWLEREVPGILAALAWPELGDATA